MPSESGAGWQPPPAGSGERRLSNSSDGSAGSGYSKALSSDSADFLTTRPRTAAVIPGKPATNPLQFVKVGPADLYRSAQEQLKRAEKVKQSKELKKEEAEDWQSNLDSWKSSRRKRVEHIIERCVEVKRMESEPAPGTRAKNKTFNEMLEERAGKRRRCPLALYAEEEVTDLSDLGIGTCSTKSSLSEDCDTHSLASDGIDLDKNNSDVDNLSNCDSGNRKLGSSANEYDTCTTTTISSPEPEEYTYEGAIEGYKSRIISQTNTTITQLHTNYKTYSNNNFEKDNSPEKNQNGDISRVRTSVSNKIEEKVSSFQQNKVNDVKNNNQKKDLPKVDIHKRREQFERENSVEAITNKPKLPDIANKKSIKERLSSLEKFTEESHQKSTNDVSKIPTEVVPLKDRLSCLEKVKSGIDTEKPKPRQSNGDLNNAKSLKERLSSLKSQTSEEEAKIVKTEVKDVSMSLKERLSCLDAARHKEIPKISVEDVNTDHQETKEQEIIEPKESPETSLKTSLSGIENQMQSFCRSLDSLDINGASTPNFDRIQSLEDLRENQTNTSPSDIETEDSGIHTGHGSCAHDTEINDLQETADEPFTVTEFSEDAVKPKIEEPETPVVIEKEPVFVIEEILEDVEDSKTEDSDSASNYHQALSQVDDLSATDEITEICMENDEDTLKSEQDISVIDALELAFQEIDSEESIMEEKPTEKSLKESKKNLNTNTNQPILKPKKVTENTSKEAVQSLKGEEMRAKEKNEVKDDFSELTQINNEKNAKIAPLYENIEFYQNGGLDTVVNAAFPLDLPPNILEPPKEKPPPPPAEDGDDELLGNGNFKSNGSTRRIKKEIRNKRTSFLGIEGQVDDSYLDADLKLVPRPDITSFLQEETKIEKLLYKKTLSHDMDSKLRESRDSGVDLDRGPSAETWYKQSSSAENSVSHSRQNSEPYTQITVTSDEEDSSKRQAAIQFTEKLATKLDNLTDNKNNEQSKIDNLDKTLQETQEVLRFEREILQLEQEELRRQRENLLLKEHQTRRKQQSVTDVTQICDKPPQKPKTTKNYRHSMPNLLNSELETFVDAPMEKSAYISEENLARKHPRVMEETLKNERVFDGKNYKNQCIIEDNVKIQRITEENRRKPMYLSEESLKSHRVSEESLKRQPFVSEEHMRKQLAQFSKISYQPYENVNYQGVERAKFSQGYEEINYLQAGYTEGSSRKDIRPPVPVLPAKPKSRESLEREITMRSSRVPSAVEYVNVDKTTVQLRPKPIVNGQASGQTNNGQYHPMSRHTLQVLSAAPTPKLISANEWLHNKNRKPQSANFNYNQHWLMQEAEQRRIEEQKNKMRKPVPSQRHSYHQDPSAQNATHRMQNVNTRSSQEFSTPSAIPEPVPSQRDADRILSVSGRKKCSHCGEELGRGAAMIIESLSLCYHVSCFACFVCGARLGDGRAGADVRVRNAKLHCRHCYSSDDGRNFSCV